MSEDFEERFFTHELDGRVLSIDLLPFTVATGTSLAAARAALEEVMQREEERVRAMLQGAQESISISCSGFDTSAMRRAQDSMLALSKAMKEASPPEPRKSRYIPSPLTNNASGVTVRKNRDPALKNRRRTARESRRKNRGG